tara:strand:- start:406 stop:843 length:438 start_codon:yes stop_codon:yes gene_type:complete
MEIQDYPNYLIYEDGRVWSKNRKKNMATHLSHKGYELVRICKNGKHKGFSIHRLIAIHYIPNPNDYPEVDHINRIRNDNRIENLKWSNQSNNQLNTNRNVSNIKYRPLSKGYEIVIKRNKIIYYKYCKNKEDAIIQRDLMLSMWS